ncbi:MAG: hypothetical protein WED15_04345 [Akkermansiaceae bacterium]
MFLKQHQSPHPKGFALVVTLSLMILLTIVAVGLLTLSSVSLRATNQGEAMATARANARMALILALGDLQQSAGPDQRITASADILPSAGAAAPGQAFWTGVWDTSSYSPKTPDTKKLLRWLVSTKNPATPATVADVKTPASDARVIFNGKDPASSVKVPKVAVNSGSANVGSYAYWVEDEGLKADLGWSEGVFSNAAQNQAARLAAAPGPDYASLDGPFTGKVNYPLAKGADNAWLANLDKALSVADMPLVMTTSNDLAWLRDKRHDVTMGSRGVMADVKLGGLRRDLSLAFEMDGTADVSATSQPAKFNQQTGEFVGGSDRLAAPQAAEGMGGVKERFLYRDTQGSGTPFAGDIVTPTAVIRGPNWWCLRDYANLYKRLSGTAGDYTLEARACYPNLSAAPSIPGYSLSDLTFFWQAGSWDSEFNSSSKYLFRPARANCAPVLLGSVCLFSALATPSTATTAKLALGLDPFFYLWNPYNRKLQFNKFAIRTLGFPGHVTFYVNRGGVRTQYGPSTSRDYLSSHAGVAVNAQAALTLTYLISGLTMAPGEIIVVSPSSSRSAAATTLNDEALPGTNTDNASGVILTKIPVADATNTAIAWQEVPLNLATDTVEFTYSNQYMVTNQVGGAVKNAGYFMLHTSLPAAGMTAADMANPTKTGEQLQALENNTLGGNEVPEYYFPGQNQVVPPVGPYAANTLLNTKNFFGAVTSLAKPTSFSGQRPNPVEVFAQFNPMPVGSTLHDIWRPCNFNQIYNMVSRAGGANTLLNECAIAFPASALRNGYWGASYAGGSTALPMSNIPTGPLFSLVSFSHAGLAVRANEPFQALGNSWANLFVSPVSPYGLLKGTPGSWPARTASDSSWLLNDALFDRYYLSGIAPDFTLNGGYSASGSLAATLGNFFGANFRDATANPVLRPYLPPNESATTVVNALGASDGYKKMGAYSLIDGAFNVNSTSIPAWTALLRGNRNLGVDFTQGGSDGASGAPYPASTAPSAPGNGSAALWSGFSRLSDAQIDTLAAKIVAEVKLRGPFMSLADFINHRVGTPKTAANYMGALQAAIEAANLNSSVQSGAGGVVPVYSGGISRYLPDPPPVGARKTTTGIPTDITQANLLLPLAPRLAARSDTFRIRGYGETRAKDGVTILARATCEAVVQRFPEYMDPVTDAANNEPWDEAGNPLAPSASSALNPINQKFGRRFSVVQFRWLSSSEI